jgi:hypothetical protein
LIGLPAKRPWDETAETQAEAICANSMGNPNSPLREVPNPEKPHSKTLLTDSIKPSKTWMINKMAGTLNTKPRAEQPMLTNSLHNSILTHQMDLFKPG